ncbi:MULTISPECIES: hypothetical protein [Chroococcidiopsis]|nr:MULTISPECIES: hypothetical protein [Chroococcidiopsis]
MTSYQLPTTSYQLSNNHHYRFDRAFAQSSVPFVLHQWKQA